MERELTPDEDVILKAVREKYGKHREDKLFFVREIFSRDKSATSAMIQVYGNNGDGPWVNLTNVASLMTDGVMTIDEIKETQI